MSSLVFLAANLLLLPCSMALPSISSLSTIANPVLDKRLISVLECHPQAQIPNYPDRVTTVPPPDGDPAKVFLERVAEFKTLTSLCGEYPAGMGYYCPPQGGALLVQRPGSQMYHYLGPPDSQYLKDACRANCYCTQIAPGDPDPSTSKPASAQCLANARDSDSDDEVDAGGCMDTYNDPQADDGILCDTTGYFYGHPDNADCERAQDGIGDGFESLTDNYEFLGVGAQSVTHDYGIAQTPFNWTSGTCYIQVSMLQAGSYYSSSNVENWDYIWGRVTAIRQKCVAGLGVGGSAKAGETEHTGIPQSIGIFVSGVNSKTKQMLDMKFGCVIDADGNYSCDNDAAPPTEKQQTGPPSSPNTPATPPAGNRLGSGAQSGPCVSHTDCDYRNGYTCGATKTAVDDFPVHSTWGTYTCKLASNVASGAIAAAAAYVALGSTCRGRCFLSSNGTLNVLANTTAGAGPEPDSVMAPMLVGPCNCTYVSAACVLSTTGIVYEDPSAKINTVVGAPSGSLCCDATTGLWRNSSVVRDTAVGSPLCPAGGSGSGGVINV